MAGTSLTDTFTEEEQSEYNVAGMEDSGILISAEQHEASLEYSIRENVLPVPTTDIEDL